MLKSIACNRGLWEDLGNGYVTRKPKKKTTSVQATAESGPDDDGNVLLRVDAQNAVPRRVFTISRTAPFPKPARSSGTRPSPPELSA